MPESLIALVSIILAVLIGHWLQRREDRRSTWTYTTSTFRHVVPSEIVNENGTLPPSGTNA